MFKSIISLAIIATFFSFAPISDENVPDYGSIASTIAVEQGYESQGSINPNLNIELQGVAWNNYQDYLSRKLAVTYLFQNAGTVPAINSKVIENKASNNVDVYSQQPLELGTIVSNQPVNAEIFYKIPHGVAGFRVFLRLSFLDEYGNQHFYPDYQNEQPVYDINVKDHGAVGDGVTDDTVAIQTAIHSAPAYSSIYFPSGTYLITNTLSVNKPVRLFSIEYATLRQTTGGKRGMSVSGSGPVEIDGLNFIGTQYKTYNANESAIAASGNSASGIPLNSLVIKNCNISNWGGNGIITHWVQNLYIQNNNVENIYYAGIVMSSVINGTVSNNDVNNIPADGVVGTNAYGIAVTRSTGTLAEYPRSKNISIDRNTVSNVPTWEGLDTHAGQNISFTNNRVLYCNTGIAVVDRDGLAPLDIDVSNNYVDWGAADGLGKIGIVFKGGNTSSTTHATGSITNNIVKNHGEAGVQNSAAIQIYRTQSVDVSNNTLIEPSSNGIRIFYHNYNFTCYGNSIIDVWTNSNYRAYGVRVGSTATGLNFNTGSISQLTLNRGTKTAAHINTDKVIIHDESPPTNVVNVS